MSNILKNLVYLFCFTGLNFLYCFDYDEVLPYGSKCKIFAISSSVCPNEGFSLFTNPAWIGLEKKVNIDSAYIQHTQTYEHPDFDQVYLNILSPFVAIAYNYPFNNKLSLALSLYPSKIGSYTINGFPRQLQTLTLAFKIKYKLQNIKYSIGTSYNIWNNNYIGISLVLIDEKSKIIISTLNTPKPLIEHYGYNIWIKPIFGFLSKNIIKDNVLITLSLSTPIIKTYKGYTKVLENFNINKMTKKAYEPLTISLGLNLPLLKKIQTSLAINYENWAKGKKHFKDIIILSDQTYAELKDIYNIATTFNYELKPKKNIYISYAKKLSPWKDGQYDNNNNMQTIGADFDKLNNVNKNIFTIGTYINYSNHTDIDLSLYYSLGKRQTSLQSNAPGYYQYQTLSLNLGINKKF